MAATTSRQTLGELHGLEPAGGRPHLRGGDALEPERRPCVLIVEDEERYRLVIGMLLSDLPLELEPCASAEQALSRLGHKVPDLLVTDLRMPGMGGLELLARVKEEQPAVPVIVVTAYGSIESAVQAMRAGAYDYLTKPFEEEVLRATVRRGLEASRLRLACGCLRQELRSRFELGQILGQSPRLKAALQLAEQVAPTLTTVLVTGESGTGKELLARAIHVHSRRADGPFVALNCAAVPASLLESELFGHERGAFTGAIARKPGRFEQARGGTLFLDELGELELPLQVKLLRVLQERRFERLGGTQLLEADARIVCATNIELERAVQEGRFRRDLYYRVSVFPIELPPLAERGDDVLLLARRFVQRFAAEVGRRVERLSPQAELLLLAYGWPGNVRELQNVIERAVILCQGSELQPGHLPEHLRAAKSPPLQPATARFLLPPQGICLEEVEKDLVLQALELAAGNKSRAARLLGLTRATLRYRLVKHGLEEGD